jgi:hypothetical protein
MGGSAGHGWAAYLPLLIFAAITAWRFRNLQKARPLRLPLLWIMPLIVTAAVCLALAALPPSGLGWLALAAGTAVGGGIGIQRSRLMRLHIEGEGDDARVMVRQSPLALVLILAVFAARRLLLPGSGDMSMQEGGHPTATALLVTDAMLGLALGMVVLSRLVLWQRARAMVAAHVFDA